MRVRGPGAPWARAWGDAMQAYADAGRWRRGYDYYREGMVSRISIVPGRIVGKVEGSRNRAYDVLIAAPVVKEVPLLRVLHFLLGDEDAMVQVLEHVPQLIPNPSRIEFMCSCPDWDEPCKHAVALWFEAAQLIAQSPGRLLRFRGITNDGPAPRKVEGRKEAVEGTGARHTSAEGTREGETLQLSSDGQGRESSFSGGRPPGPWADRGEHRVDTRSYWQGNEAALKELFTTPTDPPPGAPEWVFSPPVTWSGRGPSYTELMERIYANIARNSRQGR